MTLIRLVVPRTWNGSPAVSTTESPGRLLWIDADGTISVWHDADESELRSPVATPDGTVYFLANPGDPQLAACLGGGSG